MTFMAVGKRPDLFKVGIPVVGITDLHLLHDESMDGSGSLNWASGRARSRRPTSSTMSMTMKGTASATARRNSSGPTGCWWTSYSGAYEQTGPAGEVPAGPLL